LRLQCFYTLVKKPFLFKGDTAQNAILRAPTIFLHCAVVENNIWTAQVPPRKAQNLEKKREKKTEPENLA
jgi:hypothetical protein